MLPGTIAEAGSVYLRVYVLELKPLSGFVAKAVPQICS